MKSVLFPAFVVAVIAVFATYRIHVRRRFEKLRMSGGRKAFVRNIFDRP
jgi:hypothetical protein